MTVPTLEEVFDEFPDAAFFLQLLDVDERLDRTVVDVIVARSMQNRVVIAVHTDPPIARSLDPSIPTWMSPVEMESLEMLRPADEATYVAPAPLAAPPFHSDLFDARLVAQVQRFGLFLMVWTVNDEAEMEAAIDLGVRGIITDRPTLLEQVFVRRGLRL